MIYLEPKYLFAVCRGQHARDARAEHELHPRVSAGLKHLGVDDSKVRPAGVRHGDTACDAGAEVGWQIIDFQGEEFAFETLAEYAGGQFPYNICFRKVSESK